MLRLWRAAGPALVLVAGRAGEHREQVGGRPEVQHPDPVEVQRQSWRSWLSRLPLSVLPVLHAARPFSGGDGRRQFNFIADVVALSAPSVAYIELQDPRRRDAHGQPVTVSNGSGFIVSGDGLLLTNAHVVLSSHHYNLLVRLHDGRSFKGKVEDIDINSDLATIRIQAKDLPIMKLGESSDIRPGEWVIALGSPLSLNNTVTAGVVSSISRASQELGLRGKDMSYIQTDAAITFGNSGGPLVNLDGEAIGINSMKVTSGISFAIPIDYAKDFLSRRSEKSKVFHKYIGVTMLSLTPDIIKMLRQKNTDVSSVMHGVLIYKVIMGSPSDGAGVKPGDIITHINNNPVNSANDVYKYLEGDTPFLTLTIVRNNRILEIRVTPDDTYG